MDEIVAMTEHIVGQAKNYESDTIPGDFATLTQAVPEVRRRGAREVQEVPVHEPSCDFAFWKIMGGRQIEPQEADTLIKEREVGPLEGFRSKMGRPFSAKLKLNDANEVVFDFGNADDAEDGEAPDFSGQDAARARAPSASRNVFELGNSYVCEKAVGPDKTCDFRSRPHDPAAADRARADAQAPARSKTDLLQFVSSRTRRPFSAFLVVQTDGKVGFEFEAQGSRARRAAPRAVGGAARARRASQGQAAGRAASPGASVPT